MAILMFIGCSMDNFVGLEQFKYNQNPAENAYVIDFSYILV